jgi:hypothetical protein
LEALEAFTLALGDLIWSEWTLHGVPQMATEWTGIVTNFTVAEQLESSEQVNMIARS